MVGGPVQLVFVTRSNEEVSAWEPIQTLTLPANNNEIYPFSQVEGNGTRGPLDLFVDTTVGNETGFLYTRVLAVFTLKERVGKYFKASKAAPVILTLRDAADPVASAHISVEGKSLVTGGGRRCHYPADAAELLHGGRRCARLRADIAPAKGRCPWPERAQEQWPSLGRGDGPGPGAASCPSLGHRRGRPWGIVVTATGEIPVAVDSAACRTHGPAHLAHLVRLWPGARCISISSSST